MPDPDLDNPQPDTPDFSEQLHSKMWHTRGSRFNTARRLDRYHMLISIVNVVSATHLIGINVYQLGDWLDYAPHAAMSLTGLSIVISTIMFGFSLLAGSANLPKVAEQHRKCGEKIGKLYDRLNIEMENQNRQGVSSTLKRIRTDYHKVIDEAGLKYSSLDRDYFLLQNPESTDKREFSSIERWWITFLYSFIDIVIALLVISVPLIFTLRIIP